MPSVEAVRDALVDGVIELAVIPRVIRNAYASILLPTYVCQY